MDQPQNKQSRKQPEKLQPGQGKLLQELAGSVSPMPAPTRRKSAKPYHVPKNPIVPDHAVDPDVDAVIELIKLKHPMALDNVVNLGPSDAQRQVLERRTIVARLRVKGIRNSVYIAEALGVSQNTIARDIKILDAMFLGEAIADTRVEKGLDFLRIEAAVQAIMPQVENGSLPYIRQMVELLARKAKLLGLDAPSTVAVVDWRSELEKMGADSGSVYERVLQVVSAQIAQPVLTLDQDAEPDDIDDEAEEEQS